MVLISQPRGANILIWDGLTTSPLPPLTIIKPSGHSLLPGSLPSLAMTLDAHPSLGFLRPPS